MKAQPAIRLRALFIFSLLMSSCGPSEQEVTLRFAAQVGDEPMRCGQTYANVGTSNVEARIMDFRLYVSEIRLLTESGEEVPMQLQQDGLWQYENVALLDFENGEGDCESGTPEMNDRIVGTAPADEYTGIAFTIGVPHELNHLDAAMAPSPLNLNAMFWTWRAGYVFNRVDVAFEADGQQGAWLIHLGSTGCESAASTMPPTTECSRPNRSEIRLTGFDPANDILVADILGVLNDIDLTTSEPAPPGCMAGPNDPDCPKMFPAFGLALETGTCVDGCAEQSYIRVARGTETMAAAEGR